MRFESQILTRTLAGGLAAILVAMWFIWTGDLSAHTQITLTLAVVLFWIGYALAVKGKIVYPLRTLSNVLEGMREKDFSLRLRGARRDDALGDVICEVNALTQALQDQRFGDLEATALLRKTLAEVDVAMFGFDQRDRLCLVNDFGLQALGKKDKDILGKHVGELGLSDCLTGPTPRVVDLALPGRMRRWELRRTTYREKGLAHQLILLSDLTRTLHEEERLAWKRLIQILRHEINNSLTPIQSVAQTLRTRVNQATSPDDWQDDVQEGLEIIAARSEELGRFIASYSQLTRLPDPVFEAVDVGQWIRHVAGLETRATVTVRPGPDVTIEADRAQLDQLLINVVANAVEASLQTHPENGAETILGWEIEGPTLAVHLDDNGPGLEEDRDVFVPFFTTKVEGSGIGLALSRQIAEAHGGFLTLENRRNHSGCRATLRLPRRQAASPRRTE